MKKMRGDDRVAQEWKAMSKPDRQQFYISHRFQWIADDVTKTHPGEGGGEGRKRTQTEVWVQRRLDGRRRLADFVQEQTRTTRGHSLPLLQQCCCVLCNCRLYYCYCHCFCLFAYCLLHVLFVLMPIILIELVCCLPCVRTSSSTRRPAFAQSASAS